MVQYMKIVRNLEEISPEILDGIFGNPKECGAGNFLHSFWSGKCFYAPKAPAPFPDLHRFPLSEEPYFCESDGA